MSGIAVLAAAFLRRDFAVARSYRFAFALDLVSAGSVVVLFYYVSRIVDEDALVSGGIPDGEYFPFVVVGLAMLGLLESALVGPSTQLRADQVNGTLESLLTSPTPQWLVILLGSTYQILRSVAMAIITVAVAMVALGVELERGLGGVGLSVVILLPAVLLLAGAGLGLAAVTVTIRRTDQITGYFVFALSLLCGAYYPTNVLPPVGEAIANALPVTWILDLERAALFGGELATWQLGGLAASAACALPVGAALLSLATDRARQRGTLTMF